MRGNTALCLSFEFGGASTIDAPFHTDLVRIVISNPSAAGRGDVLIMRQKLRSAMLILMTKFLVQLYLQLVFPGATFNHLQNRQAPLSCYNIICVNSEKAAIDQMSQGRTVDLAVRPSAWDGLYADIAGSSFGSHE